MAAVGSFITGLFDGIKTRQGWEDRKRKQKFEDEDYEFTRESRGWAREDMDWTREDRAHTRSERDYLKKRRAEEDALNRKAAELMRQGGNAGSTGPDGDIWAPEDPAPAEAPPQVLSPDQIIQPAGRGPLTFGTRVPGATPRDLDIGRPDVGPVTGMVVPPPRLPPENHISTAMDSDPAIRMHREIESGARGWQQPAVRRHWAQEAAKREAELRADPSIDQSTAPAPRGVEVRDAIAPPNLTFGDRAAAGPTGAATAPGEAAAEQPAPAESPRTGVAALVAPEGPQADPAAGAAPPGAATGAAPTPDAAAASPSAAPVAAMAREITAPAGRAAGVSGGGRVRRQDAVERMLTNYATQAVPELMAGYVALGQHDKAMAFAQFAQADKTKRAMQHWGDAMYLGMTGDVDGAVRAIAQYNNSFDTGYRVIKSQSGEMRDEAGNVTGIRLAMRGPDGKVHLETFRDAQDFLTRAAMEASPEKMFEFISSRIADSQKAAYDRAADRLKHERQIELETIRAGAKNGSPRQQAIEFLAKEHPTFFSMSPEQQEAAIEQWLTMNNGSAAPREPAMARGI